MQIRTDDLTGQDVADLLQAHLEYCRTWSPPESVHALDLDVLRAAGITFWAAWDAGNLLGCGALKQIELISWRDKINARRGKAPRPRSRGCTG